MAGLSAEAKDERLTQFLSMTEDRVAPDVAQNLLEVMNWDVQAAIEQIFGGPASPGPSRPTSAMPFPPSTVPGVGAHMDLDDGASGFEDVDVHDETEAVPRPGARPATADSGMGDAQLAAAIEASFRAQTHEGRAQSEEELIAEAMRISQQEDENRKRQELRSQQEAELAESILMDQMREQQEREAREAEAATAAAEESSRREAEGRARAESEMKRARLPEEPPVGEPGRLALMFRLPNGQRLQRAFRASEAVGVLYDFVDLQNEELSGQYRLVSTMPRKAYEDREPTLQSVGIQNQFVLMVELLSDL